MNFSHLLPFPADAGTVAAQSEPFSVAPIAPSRTHDAETEDHRRFIDVLNSLNESTNIPTDAASVDSASESEDSLISKPPAPAPAESRGAGTAGGGLSVVSSNSDPRTIASRLNETAEKLHQHDGQNLRPVENVRQPDYRAGSKPPSVASQPHVEEHVFESEQFLDVVGAPTDVNVDPKDAPPESESDPTLSLLGRNRDEINGTPKPVDEVGLPIDKVGAGLKERFLSQTAYAEQGQPLRQPKTLNELTVEPAQSSAAQQVAGSSIDRDHGEKVETERDGQVVADRILSQDLKLQNAGLSRAPNDLTGEISTPYVPVPVDERSSFEKETNPNPRRDDEFTIQQAIEPVFVLPSSADGVDSTIVPEPSAETERSSTTQNHSPSDPTKADGFQSPTVQRFPENFSSRDDGISGQPLGHSNETLTRTEEFNGQTDRETRPAQINPLDTATPPSESADFRSTVEKPQARHTAEDSRSFSSEPQQNSSTEILGFDLPSGRPLAIDSQVVDSTPDGHQPTRSIGRQSEALTDGGKRGINETVDQTTLESGIFSDGQSDETQPSDTQPNDTQPVEPPDVEDRPRPPKLPTNDFESVAGESELQFNQRPSIESSKQLASKTESEQRLSQAESRSPVEPSVAPLNSGVSSSVANNPSVERQLTDPSPRVPGLDSVQPTNDEDGFRDSASLGPEFDDATGSLIDLPDVQNDGSNVFGARSDRTLSANPDPVISLNNTMPATVSNVNDAIANDAAIPSSIHSTLPDSRAIDHYAASSFQSGETDTISSFDIQTVSTLRNQVSQTLLSELRAVTRSTQSSEIFMDLHPAELGRLTLRVGMENEAVSATIVTSELATSDLLTRDKQILVDALREQGLDVGSFEVSYGGGETEHHARDSDSAEPQRLLSPSAMMEKRPSISPQTRVKASSGINLIA